MLLKISLAKLNRFSLMDLLITGSGHLQNECPKMMNFNDMLSALRHFNDRN